MARSFNLPYVSHVVLVGNQRTKHFQMQRDIFLNNDWHRQICLIFLGSLQSRASFHDDKSSCLGSLQGTKCPLTATLVQTLSVKSHTQAF
jgi:hypothetical protein